MICIDQRHAVSLFASPQMLYQRLSFAGLPRDVVVEGVHFDHAYRAFMVMLWHESFDEVPEGVLIPISREEVVVVSVDERIAELEQRLADEMNKRREAERIKP